MFFQYLVTFIDQNLFIKSNILGSEKKYIFRLHLGQDSQCQDLILTKRKTAQRAGHTV